MLTVRQLEQKTVETIYQEHLLKDFVPGEQKPLSIIQNLMKQNLYLCYGLYEEEQLLAYAFFMKTLNYKSILIDYFAVCRGYRNSGYGSIFLSLLTKELQEVDSIIFEVESGSDAADEEELKVCHKRLDFYHRNGLRDTKMHVSLFGLDMLILYLQVQKCPSEDEIYEALEAIYDEMFGKELHQKSVIVTR